LTTPFKSSTRYQKRATKTRPSSCSCSATTSPSGHRICKTLVSSPIDIFVVP
jgi:hypothetical protein